MGRLSDDESGEVDKPSLSRLLLIGDTKAGKTHWVAQAAEAGYYLLYLDGDVALPTLRKLSPKAKSRVFYLAVHDKLENGNVTPVFAQFVADFTTTGRFMWNESLARKYSSMSYKPEEKHEVWQIIPSLLGSNVILVVDSWKRLAQSILQWKANDLNTDLLEIEKVERDLYTGTGHKANQYLQLLTNFRCHVVVIGHPREYVKRSAPKGSSGKVQEKDMKIDWIQMVPHSTSNPHALTMGSNFTDIGWIEVSGSGRRQIDFRPSSDKIIGGTSEVFKPANEFGLADLIESCGNKPVIPDQPTDSWLKIYPAGEYSATPAKAIGSEKSAPIATSGSVRTSLLARKGTSGVS